jgi:hypothetical protein
VRPGSLNLSAGALDAQNSKCEWNHCGTVLGVSQGLLTGYARIPFFSFQMLLVASAAGKIRSAYLGVEGMERGGGIITEFFTLDASEGVDESS